MNIFPLPLDVASEKESSIQYYICDDVLNMEMKAINKNRDNNYSKYKHIVIYDDNKM